MAVDMRTRPLEAPDGELLRTATLANVNWTGAERCTYRDLDDTPGLRHYVELDPHRGDVGLVAERHARVVGIAWLLFLGRDDPGYGYVDEGVPELCVSVWSGYRGEGVGGLLVDALLQRARRAGVHRVSLSVEAGNPAVRLYLRCGFRPVAGAAEGTYAVGM